MALVRFSRTAEKQIKSLPKKQAVLLPEWVRSVEIEGLFATQRLRFYRDHSLKGNRYGQRSASLDYSYRVIYLVIEDKIQIVEILEVTNHVHRTK